jgi:serine/threonine-protein kinase
VNGSERLHSTLSGQRYTLVGTLPLGAITLYEAVATDGRPCWIKQAPGDNDAAVARLRYEAIMRSKLRHPALAHLIDRGRSRQCFFLVLERAPGQPLTESLRAGPLAPARVAAIGQQLAGLLEYVHRCGIILRTLPPWAVVVDALDRAVVVDIGPAWDEVSPRRSTELIPSAYISPEEAGGSGADRPSDMYALGVLLFELLAGRPPFEGTNRGELALKHMLTPPPDLRLLRPDAPPALAEVIARCLEKQPANRYRDAASLRAALAAAQSGDTAWSRAAPAHAVQRR